MKESTIQAAIVKALQKTYGDDICVENNAGTSYGKVGRPDLNVCYKGIALAMEVKKPGEVPRETQVRYIRKLTAAGCKVYVVTSVEEALNYMKEIA